MMKLPFSHSKGVKNVAQDPARVQALYFLQHRTSLFLPFQATRVSGYESSSAFACLIRRNRMSR